MQHPTQAGSDTLASLGVTRPRFWDLSSTGMAREGFTPFQRGFLSSSFNQPILTEAVKPHVSYCSMIFADCSVTTTVPDE